MSYTALLYLILAYGVFAIVPVALLVIILLRLNQVSREVAALRQRLNGATDADREGA